MSFPKTRILGVALAVASAAWIASFTSVVSAPAGAAARDGAKDYKFQTPPIGSFGVQSLAELRGKPVLIDFWGTR